MEQEERYFTVNSHVLDLRQMKIPGRILDIGGGGEGIIGRIYGEKVVAVDPLKEELEEGPEGPLKIIMDAKELGFVDASFDTVTSFFTLMYVEKEHQKKVFSEVYRVLRPAGNFMVWDVEIPEYTGGKKDVFVIPLTIYLQNTRIETAYGVMWPGREQNLKKLVEMGRETGFQVDWAETDDKVLKLSLKK